MRCDALQCARDDSLQEEGGVADISATLLEAREDFWIMSGEMLRASKTPILLCI